MKRPQEGWMMQSKKDHTTIKVINVIKVVLVNIMAKQIANITNDVPEPRWCAPMAQNLLFARPPHLQLW